MIGLIAAIPFPDFDPVLVRLGPLAVRWYGMAYLLAFILGYFLLRRLVHRGSLRVPLPALPDLVAALAAGVMLGGRFGWWLFYYRPTGTEPWYEPLAIWHGGMSFHGGLIGVALALAVWSWRNRVPMLHVADALALVAPVGLFFGRVANFVNAELVGRPSSVPWAVVFPGDALARHPSQLYEAALEGVVLAGILWGLRGLVRGRPGALSGLFLLLYGVARFGVEFTREPDAQLGFIAFGWLTMGQLLSAAMAGAGGLLLWNKLWNRPPYPLGRSCVSC